MRERELKTREEVAGKTDGHRKDMKTWRQCLQQLPLRLLQLSELGLRLQRLGKLWFRCRRRRGGAGRRLQWSHKRTHHKRVSELVACLNVGVARFWKY